MSKLYFLAVDDASFIRDLIKRSLRQSLPDVQIDEAVNGKKAQSLITRNQYDCILCDWEMPEMSGLEVLTWLREFEEKEMMEKTPFIMVTSRGDKENVVQAVQAGVTDYIGKPFSNDQLMRKVIKALTRKHKAYLQTVFGKPTLKKDDQPKGLFKDSANALMAGTAQGDAPKKVKKESSAQLLSSNSKSEALVTSGKPKKTRTRSNNKGKAQLRISSASAEGIIRDINLQEVLLQVNKDELIPTLFEQAVVDIQIPDQPNDLARINGFVCGLNLPEKDMDSEHILVNVKYVDDDPDKLAILSKYIAQVR